MSEAAAALRRLVGTPDARFCIPGVLQHSVGGNPAFAGASTAHALGSRQYEDPVGEHSERLLARPTKENAVLSKP